MGILAHLFKKEEIPQHADNEIVAVVNGEMIPADQIKDEVFAKEMIGHTIGFIPSDGDIVAPANGQLEVMYPTGHAFAVRMKDGCGLLVHIGIDTVNMKGNGFSILAKQGDTVRAGQPIVKVNLSKVKEAGYSDTVMLIVTEPAKDGSKVVYIDPVTVSKGQVINH